MLTTYLDLTNVISKVRATTGAYWTPERLAAAETEYRRMLDLRRAYPAVDLVPTADVDEIWHAHILHTRQYAADCRRLFGKFLHHEPNDGSPADEIAMAAAVAATKSAYRDQFGIEVALGDRCHGKPCHAPTSCRCR